MTPHKAEPSDDDFRKAFSLVGQFMFTWAHVEGVLNDCVGELLGMDSRLEEAVLTANMSVREKLNVIRTMLLLGVKKDSAEWKRTTKLLDALGDRNADRNIVAHNQFSPRGEGVLFYMIKAKGEFSIPDLVWSVEDFKERGVKMRAQAQELADMVQAEVMARQPRAQPNALSALFGGPTGDTPKLELLDRPMTQPKGGPRSLQTTPGTETQNNPDPQS